MDGKCLAYPSWHEALGPSAGHLPSRQRGLGPHLIVCHPFRCYVRQPSIDVRSTRARSSASTAARAARSSTRTTRRRLHRRRRHQGVRAPEAAVEAEALMPTQVQGTNNLHTIYVYRQPLGVECRGCGHRGIVFADRSLDGFQANMRELRTFASCARNAARGNGRVGCSWTPPSATPGWKTPGRVAGRWRAAELLALARPRRLRFRRGLPVHALHRPEHALGRRRRDVPLAQPRSTWHRPRGPHMRLS